MTSAAEPSALFFLRPATQPRLDSNAGSDALGGGGAGGGGGGAGGGGGVGEPPLGAMEAIGALEPRSALVLVCGNGQRVKCGGNVAGGDPADPADEISTYLGTADVADMDLETAGGEAQGAVRGGGGGGGAGGGRGPSVAPQLRLVEAMEAAGRGLGVRGGGGGGGGGLSARNGAMCILPSTDAYARDVAFAREAAIVLQTAVLHPIGIGMGGGGIGTVGSGVGGGIAFPDGSGGHTDRGGFAGAGAGGGGSEARVGFTLADQVDDLLDELLGFVSFPTQSPTPDKVTGAIHGNEDLPGQGGGGGGGTGGAGGGGGEGDVGSGVWRRRALLREASVVRLVFQLLRGLFPEDGARSMVKVAVLAVPDLDTTDSSDCI